MRSSDPGLKISGRKRPNGSPSPGEKAGGGYPDREGIHEAGKDSSGDRGVLPAIGRDEPEGMGPRKRVLEQGIERPPCREPVTIREISANPVPLKSLMAP